MFAGMNMTINVNQFGQMPPSQQQQQHQQPGQFNPYMLGGQQMGGMPAQMGGYRPQVPQQ
jgi:hypothetical protein